MKINKFYKTLKFYQYVLVFTIFFSSLQKGMAQQPNLIIKFYFSSNNHRLSSESMDSLLKFIYNKNNRIPIQIIGRCDLHGDHALNDSLSYLRAKAVRDFMVANGFPSENVNLLAGLGKREPIEPNSPFTDSLNRVVWITVPQESLPVRETSKKIKSYYMQDSVIIVSLPYDSKFLVSNPSPHPGDTLMIDTSMNQVEDVLFVKRVLYIAESMAPSRPKQVTNYMLHESAILVHPPYASQYLTRYKVPHNGDTLLIDTSFNQVNSTLFINRNLYIANDTAHLKYSLTPKEIPENTKAKVLTQALLDTLEHSSPGDAIIMRGLDFEFGYHVMPTSDLPALQAIDTALKKWPYLKLEIQGHLCCGEKGKESYDKQTSQYDLSNNRAKEVYDYLITQRVDKTRISYKGYGMEYPLADPEGDKKDQYRNRRIQFLILDK